MRHVQITHIYVLPVPEEDVEAIDSIVNAGVSIMERMMQDTAQNIRELRSDWQLMPKEYTRTVEVEGAEDVSFSRGRVPAKYEGELDETERERDRRLSKEAIENDTDHGISFAGDVMGQGKAQAMHPWDQGLWVFPEDHPLHEVEVELKRKKDTQTLERLQAASPKLKELPEGDGTTLP